MQRSASLQQKVMSLSVLGITRERISQKLRAERSGNGKLGSAIIWCLLGVVKEMRGWGIIATMRCALFISWQNLKISTPVCASSAQCALPGYDLS
jgi:hypothetical protein